LLLFEDIVFLLSFDGHEQIVFCNDEDTGLKAIIGIHNTVLGPALGGTRMWTYQSEWHALNDVLRLSRGMTYKSASGNPSPVTAFGVYMGMKAAANHKFGSDSLEGKKILVQGVGHVGETLVKLISDEGAQVIINDINEIRLEELSKKYNTNVILGNDIYNLDLDIYAPCALGATINDDTIHQLNTKVIAGAANNQLADEVKHGRILKEKGIAYAPDFLINAGGIINVYGELEGYSKEESLKKTENIYNTTLEIFKLSEKEDITTHRAAFNIAQKRIDNRKKEKNS